jgi:hypothetical protein
MMASRRRHHARSSRRADASSLRTSEYHTQSSKKHLRGVGEKEQRTYERIKEVAEISGRYGERAEEVAAGTLMKYYREEGHEKGNNQDMSKLIYVESRGSYAN